MFEHPQQGVPFGQPQGIEGLFRGIRGREGLGRVADLVGEIVAGDPVIIAEGGDGAQDVA